MLLYEGKAILIITQNPCRCIRGSYQVVAGCTKIRMKDGTRQLKKRSSVDPRYNMAMTTKKVNRTNILILTPR